MPPHNVLVTFYVQYASRGVESSSAQRTAQDSNCGCALACGHRMDDNCDCASTDAKPWTAFAVLPEKGGWRGPPWVVSPTVLEGNEAKPKMLSKGGLSVQAKSKMLSKGVTAVQAKPKMLSRGVTAVQAKPQLLSDFASPGAYFVIRRTRREAMSFLPVAGAGCVGKDLSALPYVRRR